MSDDGKQILESTRNFRRFLENVGKLLSTAEAMMKKHGYESYGKTSCSGGSNSIDWPNYWFPQEAFRFLKHKNGRILVVISAILDDINSPDSLTQPLVSAAWFKYGEEVGDKWSYNLSRIILKVQEYSLDGIMNAIPAEITSEISSSVEISSSQALAVPLVNIQSERDIEEKIIFPVVASLSGVIN